MPVRSLHSSVLKWPDARTVHQAAAAWAERVARTSADVARIGYIGSYARGDWGVGSDLDLVVVLRRSGERFERRAAQWDTSDLPVPADVLVYSSDEWDRIGRERAFGGTIVWLQAAPAGGG